MFPPLPPSPPPPPFLYQAPSGVALCGKGIVYDSGGLSIKGKAFMPGMKRDMGGAATVLASFQAVARMGGLPDGRPLHCVMCLAENSVGPESTRPDDIHTGKWFIYII